MLTTERAFFDAHVGEWRGTRLAGRFVLIRGEQLLGDYGSLEEAQMENARLYNHESALIRQVDHGSSEVSIPALSLGILSGRT